MKVEIKCFYRVVLNISLEIFKNKSKSWLLDFICDMGVCFSKCSIAVERQCGHSNSYEIKHLNVAWL